MSDPKIAFIAVRAGSASSSGPYEAVVVGAAGAIDEVWRYARFRLDGLERLIRDLASKVDGAPHPLDDQSDAETLAALRRYDLVLHETPAAAHQGEPMWLAHALR